MEIAVVLGLRIAIRLIPLGVASTRYVMTHDPTSPFHDITRFLHRLHDPAESDATLSADITTLTGRTTTVSTTVGTFELRKFIARWSRFPTGGTTEDDSQVSMHFLLLASGAPSSAWTSTEYGIVETAWNTLWTSLKVDYHSTIHLDQYRWYKSGPAWDVPPPAPYNPAERVTEVDVTGTSASNMLPPQVAVSVTQKCAIRKRWGRFYMPAPSTDLLSGTTGRVISARLSAWNTAFGVFFNTCTSNHIQPVVWSRARDAYTSPRGHLIAAQPATAYSVDSIQLDDLFDVIRSRRYSAPTLRDVTTIAAAT